MASAPVDDDILSREAEIRAKAKADPLLSLDAAPLSQPASRLPLAAVVDLSGLAALPSGATPTQFGAALTTLRESMPADLDRLSREEVRALVRSQFPDVPARMVDAALAPPPRMTTATAAVEATEAAPALVSDDAPWVEPVDGAVLLNDIAGTIRMYVVLPLQLAQTIALWIVAAFALDAASIMPMLTITAATMRAGKSTLAEIIQKLSPRGLMVSSLTPAVLFRLIDKYKPTLISDEADTYLSDEKSELRGVFNSGHSRSTAVVPRCVGDDNEVKLFSTWAAKAIAMIGKPPSTILDRSIVIELRRKRPDEQVARLRHDHLGRQTLPLRRRATRWAQDHLGAIRAADPSIPPALHDRAADNWRILMAVADVAGGDWPAGARAAAIGASASADDASESIGTELLADIRDAFNAGERAWLSSADLTAALVAMADRPWAEWSQGRPITPVKLAARLKPFGVKTYKQRDGAKTVNAYALTAFSDAWCRYLPDQVGTSEHVNFYAGETAVSTRNIEGACSDLKHAIQPMFTESVPMFRVEKAETGVPAKCEGVQGVLNPEGDRDGFDV